jgi:hypothetical protein
LELLPQFFNIGFDRGVDDASGTPDLDALEFSGVEELVDDGASDG